MAEKTLYNAPSSNHIIANYDDDISIMRNNFVKSLSREIYAPYYKPFLPISHAVFNGKDFDWAIRQAECIAEKSPQTFKAQRLAKIQQKVAIEALQALQPFFSKDSSRWLKDATVVSFQATDKVQVPIKLYGIRRADSKTRICVFNYWKTRLSDQQISILCSLAKHYTTIYTEFREIELEFIDISCPDARSQRDYRVYGWTDFPLLSDAELNVIMKSLADSYVWAKQNMPAESPRPPKPKPLGDMDDLFPA